MMALLVVGFTIGELGHDSNLLGILILLAQIAGFTIVAWVLSTKVIPHLITLLQRVLQVPHLSFGLIIGGLFLMVVGAERIGLHGTIGALLFGAALSGLPNHVRQDVMPGMRSTADGLFVPLFFASAGLHLSLAFTSLPPWTIAAVVVVPMLAKFVGAIIGTYIIRMGISFPLAAGLMAKGAAEIALLLVMFQHNLIQEDLFSLLTLIMFGYFLIVPPIISFTLSKTKHLDTDLVIPDVIPSTLVRFALDDLKVGDIMDNSLHHPESSITVRTFADSWIAPHQQDYVVTDNGSLAGIVSLSKLRYLPKSFWSSTPLVNVLSLDTPQAWPDEFAEDVLQRMADNAISVIPVVDRDEGKLIGTVTTDDILDVMILEAKGEH